jgi:hypothetical protein
MMCYEDMSVCHDVVEIKWENKNEIRRMMCYEDMSVCHDVV